MAKPIQFETVSVYGYCSEVTICTTANAITIESGMAHTQSVEAKFTDPAKLDALADAIKRAAEALRASRRVTLGDLHERDLFRFADEHVGNVRVVTAEESKMNEFVCLVERPDYGAWSDTIKSDKPVVRLVATFTHVTEGEGR